MNIDKIYTNNTVYDTQLYLTSFYRIGFKMMFEYSWAIPMIMMGYKVYED